MFIPLCICKLNILSTIDEMFHLNVKTRRRVQNTAELKQSKTNQCLRCFCALKILISDTIVGRVLNRAGLFQLGSGRG